MIIFRTAIAALVMVAATATTAYARDSYSVGISVGSYGYPAPIGYSSNYSLGYSNYPNVVYYGAPVVYHQPIVRYVPVTSYSNGHYYSNRNHRGHGHHGHRGHERSYQNRGHDGGHHRR